MNDSNSLHWSFDYNYGAQNPQFAQELVETLRGYDPEVSARGTQTAQTITHVYNVLPNYWRGYNREGNTETLGIGTAVIERSKHDNLWHYSVKYENTTSSVPTTGKPAVVTRCSRNSRSTKRACKCRSSSRAWEKRFL